MSSKLSRVTSTVLQVQQTEDTERLLDTRGIHKQILGKTARQTPTALKDTDTNEIYTDPNKLKQFVHKIFKQQAEPAPGNRKTGEFFPNEVPRNYPWKAGPDHTLDPFDLETKVGKTDHEQVSVEKHVRDKDLFDDIVDHLSNNKTPGPDEIPNELLKNLPSSMRETIHRLFVLMWMTGTTPDSWKESNTILLHKKNSELLIGIYRPIALANTMYKLWTGVIQESLSRYAEHYDILSSSQEGFRQEKNTMRQLHNLMNVLSDAKLSEQNLYMLYLDFSSAFNTIDHDKLLQIMHDLGFPNPRLSN